jgi:hypothetical protein
MLCENISGYGTVPLEWLNPASALATPNSETRFPVAWLRG